MTDTLNIAEVRPADGPRFAHTDGTGVYEVLAVTDAGVIVRGYRTGALGRIVQTGRVVRRDGQIRVRFEMARDLEDIAGTLAFDGNTFGGFAPAVVFGL